MTIVSVGHFPAKLSVGSLGFQNVPILIFDNLEINSIREFRVLRLIVIYNAQQRVDLIYFPSFPKFLINIKIRADQSPRESSPFELVKFGIFQV